MSRTSQDYLDRHPLFHSKDLDETRAIMGSHWAEHKVNVTEGTTFETTVNHAAIGSARMTYVRCPTQLQVSSSPLLDSYIIYLMKTGAAKHVLDGRLSVATQQIAVVQCPGQQVEMSTPPRDVLRSIFLEISWSVELQAATTRCLIFIASVTHSTLNHPRAGHCVDGPIGQHLN